MTDRLVAAAKAVVEAALDDCIGGGCSAPVNGCARCPYEQPEMRELREAVTAAMCSPGPQADGGANG